MPERFKEYAEAGAKSRMVIDYCARHAVVPRKSTDSDLPAPWRGVSTEDVQKGVQQEFGEENGKGTATYTWQRLGADYDLDDVLSILQNQREAMRNTGLEELADWAEIEHRSRNRLLPEVASWLFLAWGCIAEKN